MKLTFTTEAIERLKKYVAKDKQILLDFEDGVVPFSAVGSCSLDGGYRLIFIDKGLNLKDFDTQIDSNLGPVKIKGESRAQFDDQMTIRFNRHLFTLPLVSDRRTLTENVEVVDYSRGNFPEKSRGQHDC